MSFDTPLIHACRHDRRNEVAALIASGANVNEPTTDCLANTPLLVAIQCSHLETASMLLAAGADVNRANHYEETPLYNACYSGRTAVVSFLLSVGAAVNQAEMVGTTPLMMACSRGDTEVVSMLLDADADVQKTDSNMRHPLLFPCLYGYLATAKLLCLHNASRQVHPYRTAEEISTRRGHRELTAWLVASRQWCTPLHHLSTIDATCARALLRNGADIHASAPNGPTPLSLAKAMREQGSAVDGSAAQLVIDAAQPWSVQTHSLFPSKARALAVELLWVGHLLSRQVRLEGPVAALLDVWMEMVVPSAVVRSQSSGT